jgi:hypothetical protein
MPIIDRYFEGNMPTSPVRPPPRFPPNFKEQMPKVEIMQLEPNRRRGSSKGKPSPDMIEIGDDSLPERRGTVDERKRRQVRSQNELR